MIDFQTNIPIELALSGPGEPISGTGFPLMIYRLIDGGSVYLDLEVSRAIEALNLQPGETFSICKRWTGERNKPQGFRLQLRTPLPILPSGISFKGQRDVFGAVASVF